MKGKESFLYHFWLTRLTPKALVAYFQGGPLTFPKLVACTHELSWLACGYYETCRPLQATADRPWDRTRAARQGNSCECELTHLAAAHYTCAVLPNFSATIP